MGRRGARARVVETTKGHAAWRRTVTAAIVNAARCTVPVAKGAGVLLVADFYFPRPASHWTKKGALRQSAAPVKVTRPDLSKLVRAVEDSITDARLWGDDSQVIALRALKRWHPTQGAIGCAVVNVWEVAP